MGSTPLAADGKRRCGSPPITACPGLAAAGEHLPPAKPCPRRDPAFPARRPGPGTGRGCSCLGFGRADSSRPCHGHIGLGRVCPHGSVPRPHHPVPHLPPGQGRGPSVCAAPAVPKSPEDPGVTAPGTRDAEGPGSTGTPSLGRVLGTRVPQGPTVSSPLHVPWVPAPQRCTRGSHAGGWQCALRRAHG